MTGKASRNFYLTMNFGDITWPFSPSVWVLIAVIGIATCYNLTRELRTRALCWPLTAKVLKDRHKQCAMMKTDTFSVCQVNAAGSHS